jgi:amino acid adenylation domain-containing protein
MISTLPHTIEFAAKKFPEREAFRYGNESLNYAQMEFKTDQLASHLISIGVQKGDRVGVYMYRCLETAIAIYGIMKAAAVYVPLDPSLPVSRIAFLLNHCGIEHVVTEPKLKKRHHKILTLQTSLKSLIGGAVESSITSTSWESIYEITPGQHEKRTILENDLAYIMYTSGSTGKPKGIMHTHLSGLKYARLSVREFGLRKEDRLANHAPLHFDISTLGYLSGPLAAATTVIVSDAHTKMASSLAELIEKEKISIWYSVPLALVQMLQSNSLEKRDLSALRLVLFGGEVFPNKYLSQLMELCPDAAYYNVYGPAEINQCTCYRISHRPEVNEHIPIGKVWEETTYKILGDNNLEVEKGASGELVVATSTMMRGYWKNDRLTQNSLYKTQKGDKEVVYYRTGDVVKENSLGMLLFLGRNDRQVKIRGYRIEIDEIEASILKHEKVFEAAVVVLDKSENEKEIMAVVILCDTGVVEAKDILDHCRAHLPSYAIPQTIEIVQEFPRTGSGKIDRKQIVNTFINA